VPGELDPLAADLEGAAVLEGLLGRGPRRVVVAQQELARLLVPDPGDVAVEQRGRAGVVGVVVRVDEVGHPVGHAVGGGDLIDGALDVMTDGGQSVGAGARGREGLGCGVGGAQAVVTWR
jgi:hypothetical protein